MRRTIRIGVKSGMSSTEGVETVKPQSRRERAFLGPLPSDFLRVECSTTAHPSSRFIYNLASQTPSRAGESLACETSL